MTNVRDRGLADRLKAMGLADDTIEFLGEDMIAALMGVKVRKRKPNVATLIAQARKAGDRGPVRVELPDGTTSSDQPQSAEQISDDDAERLWQERIAKNASH
jgi:hypothetical protein